MCEKLVGTGGGGGGVGGGDDIPQPKMRRLGEQNISIWIFGVFS